MAKNEERDAAETLLTMAAELQRNPWQVGVRWRDARGRYTKPPVKVPGVPGRFPTLREATDTAKVVEHKLRATDAPGLRWTLSIVVSGP